MAMAFGLRYAPSQPAGPQDSASAEAHCLQASKAENTPAAFLIGHLATSAVPNAGPFVTD
jgi:hypothetical protein